MNPPNTFWRLLRQYKVRIPMIQRDYAQGRSDEQTKEIRELLLENITEAILRKKKLDFDFIYGSVSEDELFPLDGQQRLTTLFLLHWYFAVKENKDVSEIMVKFSYETRISARDFCEQLAKQKIPFSDFSVDTPASVIRNKKWFQYHWQADPTVEAMLVMLNSIHESFCEVDQPVLESLTSEDCPITFSFLELEHFGLSDELYIKMNSRGKPLSTFENFKAQFEQLLEKNGFIEESKQFSLRIEQEWTDLLWEYRDEDNTIDRAFMRLFTFISSALYLKANPFARNASLLIQEFSRIHDLASVYNKKENVSFLFDALSLWKNRRDIHQQFTEIFEKLPLFNNNIQLMEKCLNNSLQLDERVLLYTVVAKKIAMQETDLIDTLRVVRNLLIRVRQGNSGVYNSNLRVENIGPILSGVDYMVNFNKPIYEVLLQESSIPGFASTNWGQEKEKAELLNKHPHLKQSLHTLEDMPRLKGAVHQWLDAFVAFSNQLTDTLVELDKVNAAFVSRAMLSLESYQVQLGWSNLGPRYLFGGKRANREYLWTLSENSLKPLFTRFTAALINAQGRSMKEKVESLINPGKWTIEDWQYYFIKYDTMLKDSHQVYTNSGSNRTFDIERLSGINLQAEHINPFYEAIVELIGDNSICRIVDCQKRLSERSEIRTINNAVFRLVGSRWTYDVDSRIQADLDRYAETLSGFDVVETGYALVMKAHELAARSA
ncbi:DUF262 domain-containing protein [Saccharibacillus qingshengii]|uniref:DUF262 domain-containing protein n=1 Tax=Saccharibacillus qingshengii TaxID=1763540 RepID=UPI00155813E7|nr:DUF262 domain-containing protein [Saccharibacillus qingshengii]